MTTMNFSLLRNGLTSTSVTVDLHKLSFPQRFMLSKSPSGSVDPHSYHYYGLSESTDIITSDKLEVNTGISTGTIYAIVALNRFGDDYIELNLERME